mmetsp:Transcript_10756/g.26547  ORF Transcript_10756/g.26547 Transcript_10756/m.26547 type:complete len:227 (+) Transcript_10756:1146-1826(+)
MGSLNWKEVLYPPMERLTFLTHFPFAEEEPFASLSSDWGGSTLASAFSLSLAFSSGGAAAVGSSSSPTAGITASSSSMSDLLESSSFFALLLLFLSLIDLSDRFELVDLLDLVERTDAASVDGAAATSGTTSTASFSPDLRDLLDLVDRADLAERADSVFRAALMDGISCFSPAFSVYSDGWVVRRTEARGGRRVRTSCAAKWRLRTFDGRCAYGSVDNDDGQWSR